jgi:hypothetical protein
MTTATETKTLTSLTIIVREWFDKTYGNTYYSAKIVANGELVHTFGMSYGHGELTVLYRANSVLAEIGFELPGMQLDAGHYDYRTAGVSLVIDTTDVARKKDLHK